MPCCSAQEFVDVPCGLPSADCNQTDGLVLLLPDARALPVDAVAAGITEPTAAALGFTRRPLGADAVLIAQLIDLVAYKVMVSHNVRLSAEQRQRVREHLATVPVWTFTDTNVPVTPCTLEHAVSRCVRMWGKPIPRGRATEHKTAVSVNDIYPIRVHGILPQSAGHHLEFRVAPCTEPSDDIPAPDDDLQEDFLTWLSHWTQSNICGRVEVHAPGPIRRSSHIGYVIGNNEFLSTGFDTYRATSTVLLVMICA